MYSDALSGPGNYGSFWSSTVYSSSNAYYLYFGSTNVSPAINYYRYYGRTVRWLRSGEENLHVAHYYIVEQ